MTWEHGPMHIWRSVADSLHLYYNGTKTFLQQANEGADTTTDVIVKGFLKEVVAFHKKVQEASKGGAH